VWVPPLRLAEKRQRVILELMCITNERQATGTWWKLWIVMHKKVHPVLVDVNGLVSWQEGVRQLAVQLDRAIEVINRFPE
jgi:hypothetical protein